MTSPTTASCMSSRFSTPASTPATSTASLPPWTCLLAAPFQAPAPPGLPMQAPVEPVRAGARTAQRKCRGIPPLRSAPQPPKNPRHPQAQSRPRKAQAQGYGQRQGPVKGVVGEIAQGLGRRWLGATLAGSQGSPRQARGGVLGIRGGRAWMLRAPMGTDPDARWAPPQRAMLRAEKEGSPCCRRESPLPVERGPHHRRVPHSLRPGPRGGLRDPSPATPLREEHPPPGLEHTQADPEEPRL